MCSVCMCVCLCNVMGNSLLMVTPPGSPLPVTHANHLSVEAKTLPDTNVSPHAQSTPHRDHLLIYHDPVYRFTAERHHPDGWTSSQVQGVMSSGWQYAGHVVVTTINDFLHGSCNLSFCWTTSDVQTTSNVCKPGTLLAV